MAKLKCAKCGGKVTKMGNGGVTPSKAIPRVSMGLNFGIPQTGTTNYSAPTMQKGGSTNSLPKARLGSIIKGISKFFGPAIGATGKSSKIIKPAAKAVKSAKSTSGIPGVADNLKFMAKNIGGGGLIGIGIAAGLTKLGYIDRDIRNKNKVAVNKNKVKVNANKVKVNANKQ